MPIIFPSQVVNVIDLIFPAVRDNKHFSLYRTHSIHCAAIINMIDKLPQELLVLDRERFSGLVSAIAALETAIQDWRFRDFPLERTPGLGKQNPVTTIRNILALCPDEFPSEGTTELNFIEDVALRKSLKIDLSATNKALSNGEWKAATVLSGSVLEALLLWSINQSSQEVIENAVKELVDKAILKKNHGYKPENWSLHSFIEVATKLKIIEDDTAQQAKLAKGFRNLIHPGREIRLRQKCNRGTALAAVAAVELTIRNLSIKYGDYSPETNPQKKKQ